MNNENVFGLIDKLVSVPSLNAAKSYLVKYGILGIGNARLR